MSDPSEKIYHVDQEFGCLPHYRVCERLAIAVIVFFGVPSDVE